MNQTPCGTESGSGERRKDSRYEASFPARIVVGEGQTETTFEARVHNVSRGGLLVEAPGIPAGETRVRVHFRIPQGVFPEEFVHGAITTTAEIRRRGHDDHVLGLAFQEPLPRDPRFSGRPSRIGPVLLLAFGGLILFLPRWTPWGTRWDIPVLLFSGLTLLYALGRLVLAAAYKPARAPQELPLLSVLMAVRNGEKNLERNLRSVMTSDYPADRLQVIVVDDASTDRSLENIQEVRKKWPDIVAVHLLKPAGRRYALATGIALATGDLIAFCDADGFVLPDSLRNLVSRFSAPDTAAVTGQDEAENEASGFTARMQGAGRFLACRVLQAAESVTGSVSCLTSPLMAFRRDRINEALDEWLAQQISEDPDEFGTTDGLIGCILRRGGRVVYESGARIVLPVPDRFPEARTRLFRTQVARLEESLRTPGWPRSARPLALLPIHGGILLTLVSPFLVLRALVWLARMRRPEPLLCLVCVFIVYALACSLYLLFKRPRSCVPGFFFWGLFSLWTVVQSIGVLFAAGRPRVAADRAVS